jgi:hypothetical protein
MTGTDLYFMQESDLDDSQEFSAAVAEPARWSDDVPLDPALQRQISALLNAITRIGGEVSSLRAEMDGLLDTNRSLTETFDKLKEVLVAKGTIDLDDFDLACEVMDCATVPLSGPPLRKLVN